MLQTIITPDQLLQIVKNETSLDDITKEARRRFSSGEKLETPYSIATKYASFLKHTIEHSKWDEQNFLFYSSKENIDKYIVLINQKLILNYSGEGTVRIPINTKSNVQTKENEFSYYDENRLNSYEEYTDYVILKKLCNAYGWNVHILLEEDSRGLSGPSEGELVFTPKGKAGYNLNIPWTRSYQQAKNEKIIKKSGGK